MNVLTYFLLFGTFAHINSNPVTTTTEDRKSGNLALKSVKELNVKGTDKTVNGDKDSLPHSTVETFTDFVQELVIILNTYNDDVFEDFINILDKKIRKYHYKGCKFYELKGKHEFRSLLAEKLYWLTSKPISEKRAFINERINKMKRLSLYDINVQELLDYINFLYKDDAKLKFRQILTDLRSYSSGYGKTRTRDDFDSLINECIKAAVFIYSHVDDDVRQELKRIFANINEFQSATTSTTNFIDFKPKTRKSNTEEKAHVKEENKGIRIFRTYTRRDARQEEESHKTSERDEYESASQQKIITHSSTNESAAEVMFYMTTEKPRIVYKSESKSKLVERMLREKSSGRVATGRSTTTQRLRLSSKMARNIKSFKTDIESSTSAEESSLEIFNSLAIPWPITPFARDKRGKEQDKGDKRRELRKNFKQEDEHLQDYIKRIIHLEKEVRKLQNRSNLKNNCNKKRCQE